MRFEHQPINSLSNSTDWSITYLDKSSRQTVLDYFRLDEGGKVLITAPTNEVTGWMDALSGRRGRLYLPAACSPSLSWCTEFSVRVIATAVPTPTPPAAAPSGPGVAVRVPARGFAPAPGSGTVVAGSLDGGGNSSSSPNAGLVLRPGAGATDVMAVAEVPGVNPTLPMKAVLSVTWRVLPADNGTDVFVEARAGNWVNGTNGTLGRFDAAAGGRYVALSGVAMSGAPGAVQSLVFAIGDVSVFSYWAGGDLVPPSLSLLFRTAPSAAAVQGTVARAPPAIEVSSVVLTTSVPEGSPSVLPGAAACTSEGTCGSRGACLVDGTCSCGPGFLPPFCSAAIPWRPLITDTWVVQPAVADVPYVIEPCYDASVFVVDLGRVAKASVALLRSLSRKVVCTFSAGSVSDALAAQLSLNATSLGSPVFPGISERWIDIRSGSTAGQASAAAVVAHHLARAVSLGCDGVLARALDAWNPSPHILPSGPAPTTTLSGFAVTAADQLGFNRMVAREASRRGLAVGIANDGAQYGDLVSVFDFAALDSCLQLGSCSHAAVFFGRSKPVVDVERGYGTAETCTAALAAAFPTPPGTVVVVGTSDPLRPRFYGVCWAQLACDTTPPVAPADPVAVKVSLDGRFKATWSACSDPESRIARYEVAIAGRNGTGYLYSEAEGVLSHEGVIPSAVPGAEYRLLVRCLSRVGLRALASSNPFSISPALEASLTISAGAAPGDALNLTSWARHGIALTNVSGVNAVTYPPVRAPGRSFAVVAAWLSVFNVGLVPGVTVGISQPSAGSLSRLLDAAARQVPRPANVSLAFELSVSNLTAVVPGAGHRLPLNRVSLGLLQGASPGWSYSLKLLGSVGGRNVLLEPQCTTARSGPLPTPLPGSPTSATFVCATGTYAFVAAPSSAQVVAVRPGGRLKVFLMPTLVTLFALALACAVGLKIRLWLLSKRTFQFYKDTGRHPTAAAADARAEAERLEAMREMPTSPFRAGVEPVNFHSLVQAHKDLAGAKPAEALRATAGLPDKRSALWPEANNYTTPGPAGRPQARGRGLTADIREIIDLDDL